MKATSPGTINTRDPRRAWYTTIACLVATAPAISKAATTEAARPAQQCLTDLRSS